MDAEHRRLLAAIRAAAGSGAASRAEPAERLALRAHVPNRLDAPPGGGGGGGGGGGEGGYGGRGGGAGRGGRLTVKLYVGYEGPGTISQARRAAAAASLPVFCARRRRRSALSLTPPFSRAALRPPSLPH